MSLKVLSEDLIMLCNNQTNQQSPVFISYPVFVCSNTLFTVVLLQLTLLWTFKKILDSSCTWCTLDCFIKVAFKFLAPLDNTYPCILVCILLLLSFSFSLICSSYFLNSIKTADVFVWSRFLPPPIT